MADTAKRLCGPIALTTVTTVVYYTVPAATTTIVRNIHVVNTSISTASSFSLAIGDGTAATRLFSAYSTAGQAVIDWSGFLVLNAGDTLTAAGNPATLTMTISGVEVA